MYLSTRRANTPNVQVYYLGQLIKVVKVIKYLGLNFAGDRCCSPSVEHLIITAERTRHAVQNRISNMGGLSPELKLRLGNLLIRPVASFGCQIWGVNFLDLSKGVDGNDLKKIHLSYLRHVLGVGRGLPYGSGLGLSRCLGPGECLHSFIHYRYYYHFIAIYRYRYTILL